MSSLFKYVLTFVLCLAAGSCATLAGVNEPYEGELPGDTSPTIPYDRQVEGMPRLDLTVKGGIYIWRIGETWSVRVARKRDRPTPLTLMGPVTAGTVRVENAQLVDVRKYQMNQLSDAQFRRNKITFKVEQREDIGNSVEGFDFRIKPLGLDYCVTFKMTVDKLVPSADLIYMGSFMHNPDLLPLRICQRSFN